MSRSAWIAGGFGLAIVACLLAWMGKTLDTKAPILIDRGSSGAAAHAATPGPEEAAAREEAAMRELVARRAPALASRAAGQAFSGEEAARARCTFTGATLVHRDGPSAYWNAEFACVDPARSGGFPNLTSVSVRLEHDGKVWIVAN